MELSLRRLVYDNGEMLQRFMHSQRRRGAGGLTPAAHPRSRCWCPKGPGNAAAVADSALPPKRSSHSLSFHAGAQEAVVSPDWGRRSGGGAAWASSFAGMVIRRAGPAVPLCLGVRVSWGHKETVPDVKQLRPLGASVYFTSDQGPFSGLTQTPSLPAKVEATPLGGRGFSFHGPVTP